MKISHLKQSARGSAAEIPPRPGHPTTANIIGAEAPQEKAAAFEDFLAFLAQDLHEPLSALDVCSRLLRKRRGDRLNGEGRRVLDTVSQELERTSQLLHGLITYTRVGVQPFEPVPVDMTALVQRVCQTICQLSPTKPAEVRTATLPSVLGDEVLLRHALFNLLSNSLKFTRARSEAMVEIAGRRLNGCCEFRVRDNGIGFDMGEAHRLFGPFQRLHEPAPYEGSGLGLAIAGRIVRRHGGRIWAESTPGQGATFFFTIPAAD